MMDRDGSGERIIDRVALTSRRHWAVCGALAVTVGSASTLVSPFVGLVAAGALLIVIGLGLVTVRPGRRELDLLGFGLVLVAVLLVPFNVLRPVPGATLADLLLVGAAFVAVLALPGRRNQSVYVPAWLWGPASLLIVAALLVELFPPQHPSEAARYFPGGVLSHDGADPGTADLSNLGAAVRFAGTLLLLPILVAIWANSRERLRAVVCAWVVGAALSAAVALIENASGLSVRDLLGLGDDLTGVEGVRPAGGSVDPNALGLSCAMALPGAFYLLSSSSGRRSYWLYLTGTGLLLAAIGLSGSRAGLIAGAAGLVFSALLFPAVRKYVVWTSVATLAVLVLLAGSLPPAVERLIGGESETAISADTALAARLMIYPEVTAEIERRPVVGYGFEYVRGAHNLYLQLLHAGGLICLGAFGWFVVGAVYIGAGRLAVQHVRGMSAAAAAALVVWLVFGVSAPAVFDRYLYVPVGILAAAAVLSRPHWVRSSAGAISLKPSRLRARPREPLT